MNKDEGLMTVFPLNLRGPGPKIHPGPVEVFPQEPFRRGAHSTPAAGYEQRQEPL